MASEEMKQTAAWRISFWLPVRTSVWRRIFGNLCLVVNSPTRMYSQTDSTYETRMDGLMGLSVFVAAVEEGSIAAAGKRFGLSAVMAGRHLSALEERLSARLHSGAGRAG